MQTRDRKETIRTIKGLILSLLLHLLMVLLFWVSTEKIFFAPPMKQEKRITMDLSHFVPPPPPPAPKPVPPPPKPTVQPEPKPEPIPKKTIEQKPEPIKKVLEEKKILTAKKDVQENNVTKSAQKASKKIVKKEKPKKPKKKIVKKKIVKKEPKKVRERSKKQLAKTLHRQKPTKRVVRQKPRQKKYASPLANSLMGSSRSIRPSPSQQASGISAQRVIKKLYGSEFDGYSPEQKRFIRNNLAIIHRITQTTLVRNGYPEIAARTGQQGINVVSFYLHPNGNITGLHLDQRMGYEALDRNTLQVIRIAYKDYPLPTKTTKIKFFVQYSINGY